MWTTKKYYTNKEQEVQGSWRSAWSLARQEKVTFKCLPGIKLLGKSYVATRIMLSKFLNALNCLRLTLTTPWDSPFKVIKVKCNHTTGLLIYNDFLLRFTSNLPHRTPSKSQWPWLWPYKVTQVEMWWCCWTLHMCNVQYTFPHRLYTHLPQVTQINYAEFVIT